MFFLKLTDSSVNIADFKEILIEDKYTPGREGSNGKKHYNVLISHKLEKLKDYDISLHVFLSAKYELEKYKDFIDELSRLTNLPIRYLAED